MESLIAAAIAILAALAWALIEKRRRAPYFALMMLLGLSLCVSRVLAALHTLAG